MFASMRPSAAATLGVRVALPRRLRLLLGAQADALAEPLQRGVEAVAAVGLVELLDEGAPAFPVREQLGEGRLEGHQGADLPGRGGGQLEPDEPGDAVAEDVGRPRPDRVQDPAGVVGVDREQLVGGRAVQAAARHAPRVVGHHREAGREPPGEDRVERGIGRHPGMTSRTGPDPRTS
jgi:hypothetical protein